MKVEGYSDSDWATSSDSQSISKYAFELCSANLLISSKSARHYLLVKLSMYQEPNSLGNY